MSEITQKEWQRAKNKPGETPVSKGQVEEKAPEREMEKNQPMRESKSRQVWNPRSQGTWILEKGNWSVRSDL